MENIVGIVSYCTNKIHLQHKKSAFRAEICKSKDSFIRHVSDDTLIHLTKNYSIFYNTWHGCECKKDSTHIHNTEKFAADCKNATEATPSFANVHQMQESALRVTINCHT